MIKLIDMNKAREELSKLIFPDGIHLGIITSIINDCTANTDMTDRMVSLCDGEKIKALDTVIDWPSMSDNTISDFEPISSCCIGDYYDRSSTLPVFRKVENFF